MKNAIYLQGGGPTSVINSSFYGVIKMFQKNDGIDTLYGSKFGLNGLINDDLILIDKNKDYSFLKNVPGAILGSSRIKLKNEFDEIYYQILETLKKHNIRYIFINGGNDTMDCGKCLTNFFNKIKYDCLVVGICKTIDNDLMENDFSPGFASAVSYITRTIMEISLDTKSYKKGRVTIVETMGRDAGWLCASTCISQEYGLGPDLIYVPEATFSLEQFIQDVDEIYKNQKRVLVCVSEALKDKNGDYVFAKESQKDSFGHIQLGSVSKNLCDLVEKKLHYSTRSIELNLMQRCASLLANKQDIEIAISCGEKAFAFALNNNSGVVCVKDENGNIIYSIKPFEKVANKVRLMPKEYINEKQNGISLEGRKYFDKFKVDELKFDIPEEFCK